MNRIELVVLVIVAVGQILSLINQFFNNRDIAKMAELIEKLAKQSYIAKWRIDLAHDRVTRAIDRMSEIDESIR